MDRIYVAGLGSFWARNDLRSTSPVHDVDSRNESVFGIEASPFNSGISVRTTKYGPDLQEK